jgi:hypothetical protein
VGEKIRCDRVWAAAEQRSTVHQTTLSKIGISIARSAMGIGEIIWTDTLEIHRDRLDNTTQKHKLQIVVCNY